MRAEFTDYLDDLSIGDLEQEHIAHSDEDAECEWSVFLALDPVGTWVGVVSEVGADAAAMDVEWFLSLERARLEAEAVVANLRTTA